MISTVPLIYSIIYVTYELLAWMKVLQMSKIHEDHPTLESQEPDRLLHPEEYAGSEEHKPPLLTMTKMIALKISKLRPILHVATVSNHYSL